MFTRSGNGIEPVNLALAVLLMSGFTANGVNVRAVQSGSWLTGSTWVTGAPPQSGDTADIPDGLTVTVQGSGVVGTSGVKGTVAITLNNTGQLIIAPGGTLVVRGDMAYTTASCANTTAAVTMQAGSTLEFDSSLAAVPASTYYTFGQNGNGGCRGFVSTGTATSHNVVRSNAGGASGGFSLRGFSSPGGSMQATFTDFLRIGDANTNGWEIGFESSGHHLVVWDVTYSTFTNCGTIRGASNIGIDVGGTFRHSYNVHSTSNNTIFSTWLNIIDPGTSGGTRELRGNVFDTAAWDLFYPWGFNIWGNYFGQTPPYLGYWRWNSWKGNFLRVLAFQGMQVVGDLYDTMVFMDTDQSNMKPLQQAQSIPASLYGVIADQAGTTTENGYDSGELWWGNPYTGPAPPGVYGIYNTIVLPNMIGYSPMELGAITQSFTNLSVVAEHNTWFGGKDITPDGTMFPAVQIGEGGNNATHTVSSYKSNIVWNPQLDGHPSYFTKLEDLSFQVGVAAPITDYCAPENCDFNTGWGHTATRPSLTQYVNQGRGYIGKFTATPGVHDVDVDPQFVDYQRTTALFDSKYLGYNPPAWSTGVTYGLDDMVSSSDATIYWGLAINYRYLGCGGNPQPGVGPGWRACWEWASLYHIRQAIAAGQTYDDQAIGVHGDDVITALLQWIRSGYSPTNQLLLGAAHDAGDIGAVPVSSPAPTSGTSSSASRISHRSGARR